MFKNIVEGKKRLRRKCTYRVARACLQCLHLVPCLLRRMTIPLAQPANSNDWATAKENLRVDHERKKNKCGCHPKRLPISGKQIPARVKESACGCQKAKAKQQAFCSIQDALQKNGEKTKYLWGMTMRSLRAFFLLTFDALDENTHTRKQKGERPKFTFFLHLIFLSFCYASVIVCSFLFENIMCTARSRQYMF